MIKVSVRGQLPPAVRALLDRTGAHVAEPGEVVVVWYDDQKRQDDLDYEHLDALGPHLEPVFAFCARPDLCEAALRAGAVEAFSALPQPVELRLRFEAVARYAESWRARSRSQLRRAHRLAEDLDANRALLDGVLNASPVGVVVADFRGRLLRLNGAAERILGYSAADAIAHVNVADLYNNVTDARRVLAEIRAASNGVAEVRDLLLRARTGEPIPIRMFAGELNDAQGEPVATFGVFEDLRERESLKNRLGLATERLIAVEKRAALVTLASTTAHELNQPLTAVMGSLEILEMRGDLADDVRLRLKRAYGQLERMARLIRELGQSTLRRGGADYVGTQHLPDPSETPSVSSRSNSGSNR